MQKRNYSAKWMKIKWNAGTDCWCIKINVKKKTQQGHELWRKQRGFGNRHENISSMTLELRRSEKPNFWQYCLHVFVEVLLFYTKVACVLKKNYTSRRLSCFVTWLHHHSLPQRNGELLCRPRSSPEKFLHRLTVRLRHAQCLDKPVIPFAWAVSPINLEERPHFYVFFGRLSCDYNLNAKPLAC